MNYTRGVYNLQTCMCFAYFQDPVLNDTNVLPNSPLSWGILGFQKIRPCGF